MSFALALSVFAGPRACVPAPQPPPTGGDGVVVHLFEWPWPDVARECERVLGPAGYAAVQVSPPQEHVVVAGRPWWERYQPVSHRLEGRLGDRAAFSDMVRRCDRAGVDVIVDVVLNHATGLDAGVGSAGTPFTRYRYPGLHGDEDFHACRRPIADWGSRWEIQQCELFGLADLDTSRPRVQARAAAFLSDLAALGVDGVRIDSAKHVEVSELRAILELAPDLDVVQEVVDLGGEVVGAREYLALGRVTDFRYARDLSATFRTGQLAWLRTFGEPWGLLPSASSLVFVDNHDTQRAPPPARPLTFEDGRLHELAVAFALAWPHGRPRVMSSYAFADRDQGPPAYPNGQMRPALTPAGACSVGRVCEHRARSTLGMVGFRAATEGAPVARWWTDGADQIAFSRGALGFVAINRDPRAPLRGRFATGLPPGRYCDVTTGVRARGGCTGRAVDVDDEGLAAVALAPMDVLAIHVGW
jgi:alpha-amylase